MADAWSNDPDRTTRRDDTRTPEQVTAETFRPRCTCGATVTGDMAVHLREHYYGPVEDSHDGVTRYRAADDTATVVRDADGTVLRRYVPCCAAVVRANKAGHVLAPFEHVTDCPNFQCVSEGWLSG